MILDAMYRAARPALLGVGPERAHRLAILALKAVPARRPQQDDPILRARFGDLDLSNPIGLGAGFDKDGEVPGALAALGFGHVEIGTVTPRPQAGNPKPRLFRLEEDRGVVNRYGFNSSGIEAMTARLAPRGVARRGIVGINLGKNKETADEVADFVTGLEAVCHLADYLVVNVSSPNTPGLRDLQGRAAMDRVVTAVLSARARAAAGGREPPLLVKLAPDLDEPALADAAEVALATGLDGLIMGNTTLGRPPDLISPWRAEAGGLSGQPLRDLATQKLFDLYRLTGGRIMLIGCGGVATGEDAYARIRAGASLVQLYTALVFHGPGQVVRIKRRLAELLRRDGYASVVEAVAADHR